MGSIQDGSKEKTKPSRADASPPRFHVVMHNDDYTTMEFVVSMLEKHFRKSPSESHWIMLTIHHKGAAVCGTYPRDIADSKVAKVHKAARADGYPLRCSVEEE